MTHPDCCRFRLASLNSLSKGDTLDSRREHPQTPPREFLQDPVVRPTFSTGTEILQPIHDIFVAPNSSRDASEDQDPQDPDLEPKRAMFFRVGNKESNSRLHDIARVLRKRMSRESEALKGSSMKNSRSSLKENDLERRRELRRVLHRRLEEELVRDSQDSSEDTDAVPIIDFCGILGGDDDSDRGDVDQIRYLAAQFKTSSPSSARGLQRPRYLPGQAGQLEMHVGVSVSIPRIRMINRTNSNPKASYIPGANLAESSRFPLGRCCRVSASV